MKQKMIAVVLAMALCVTGVFGGVFEAKAEETGESIDFSYLLTNNALVGYAESQTRGVYLLSGRSIINEMSVNKIGAGGTTTAAKRCTVSLTCIVERKASSGWVRVTSWTQTNEDAFSAMISRSLTVGTGYYYRVRSSHYAASDVSSSWTGALWMGN